MKTIDPAKVLLGTVICVTLLLPWADVTEAHFLVFRVFALFTVGVGLWRVLGQTWPLRAMAFIVPLMFVLGRAYVPALMLASLAYAFIIFNLLRLIFSHEKVTHHTVATAITVFLLIDLDFTLIYSWVELLKPA